MKSIAHEKSTSEKNAFTLKEFCRAYGIGRTMAYRQIAAGHLKTRHAGRRVLVLREDAEDWAAALPSS